MILVHILAKNNEQAHEIVAELTDRKLLLHAMLFEKTVYQKNTTTRKLEGLEQVMVMGKTKALLFNTINKLLLKKYPDHMPMLYAVPIIYMDEEQITTLRAKTAKV
jgi:uncharacterized protein involved in tolerance to divalent cations